MIKIIALISMLLDHIGKTFFPDLEVFTYIGRLALPLFAWGIVRGFQKTSDFKKYTLRLFGLGGISQYPYMLLFDNGYVNICFTLLVGLLCLKLIASKWNIVLRILLIAILASIADIFDFEYGMYGVAIIIAFYLFKNKLSLFGAFIFITFLGIRIYGFSNLQYYSIFSILVIAAVEKYNFKLNKYVGYLFYPVHILILFILTKI